MFEDIDLAFPFTIIKEQQLSVYFHDGKRSVHVNIYFVHMQKHEFKDDVSFFFFFFFFFGGGGGRGEGVGWRGGGGGGSVYYSRSKAKSTLLLNFTGRVVHPYREGKSCSTFG